MAQLGGIVIAVFIGAFFIGALFVARPPSSVGDGTPSPIFNAAEAGVAKRRTEDNAHVDVGNETTPNEDSRSDATQEGSQAVSLPPLPPENAPLQASIEALLQRAEAGDPIATCRVIINFQTCRNRASALSRARYFRGLASDAKTDAVREMNVRIAARFLERADQEDPLCEGNLSYGRPDFAPKVAKGLRALSTDQKLLLAMTDDFGNLVRLPASWTQITSEESLTNSIYPQYLVDLDMLAIDNGILEANPLALEGKIILHMPTHFAKLLGLRTSSPDPYKFALHSIVMREVYGEKALGPVVDNVLFNVMMHMQSEDSNRLIQEAKSMTRIWKSHRSEKPSVISELTRRASNLCGR